MATKPFLTRREALRGLAWTGIGAFASACGGRSGGDAVATATRPAATSTLTPSAAPTSSPTAPSSRTATLTPSAAPTSSPTAPSSRTATQAAPATPTATPQTQCLLTPRQTEGPFYLDLNLLRRDVREDRQGAPLRLSLQVVDADGCAPIRDALVDIWHTDARGVYSGFPGQPGGVDATGQTFLRGYQVSDADGRVEFITIYPGWYPGRAVHVHLRVHLDATTLVSSQLYFDDTLTDAVHAQPPYDTRGRRDTTNQNDGIIRSGGVQSLSEVILEVVADGSGYLGSKVIGIVSPG